MIAIKKRLLLFLLGAFMTLPGLADDFPVTTSKGTLTCSTGPDGTCYVKSAPASLTEYVIPPSVLYNGSYYTVTEIGQSAFSGCDKLTDLKLPNTLTTINTKAFSGCSALTSIVLPPSVELVGSQAFAGCSGLKKVYIGPNVTTIGANAFNGTSLTDVYITAPKSPIIQSTTFPSTDRITLHVQDEMSLTTYMAANHWKNFSSTELMNLPAAISTYNDVNIFNSSPMKANFGETASRSYFRLKDETMTFNTSLTGSPDQPTVFWRSSAPEKVYVESSGKFTVRAMSDTPVKLTGESIYANGPVIEIVVNNCHLAGSIYYSDFDDDNGTCSVVGPSSRSVTSVIIPETVEVNGKTYTVTSVADLGFIQCKSLSSVTLPQSINKLGYRSFYRTIITGITLPTSLKTIGGDAFKGTKLTSIVIPNSVTSLGPYVFDSCTDLATVTIGSSVPEIKGYTFNGCSKLTSITLPPSVTLIGANAFAGCSGLTTIYMGPNVKQIVSKAFQNSTALKNIYITSPAVPTISADSFDSTVYSGATLYLQGSTAQALYQKHTNWGKFNTEIMTEPASMSTYNNINIFPDKKLTAYPGETATTSLLLQAGKTAKFTTSLTPAEGQTLDQPAIFWTSSNSDCIYMDNSGNLTMNSIPQDPVTVTAKSIYANTPVIEITMNGGYTYKDGDNESLYYCVLNEDAATCSVVAPENSELTSVVIPEKATINGKEYTVAAIASLAFYNCTSLNSVTIPNTVKSLGYRAFYNTALTNVKLPTSLTSLGGDAFKRTKLKSIEIPNSVTSMGFYAFDGCKDLESVIIGTGVPAILNYTFNNCTSLKTIILPPSVKSIGNSAFYGCSNLKSIYMGSGITKIGDDAFTGATALTDIYVTSQKVPTVSESTFPASVNANATLHLQGDATEAVYRKNEFWNRFSNAAKNLVSPTAVSTYNGVNIFPTSPLTATEGQTATTTILLSAGKTATYTTTLTHDISGLTGEESAALSKMYWRTSAPDYVYVDHNGTLRIVNAPNSPVIVTGETLYASSPVIQVTIRGSYAVEGQELYYTIINEDEATCSVATTVNSSLTSVVIPESVPINGKEYTIVSVSDLAFYNCTYLASVTIPNTVKSLGYRAFYGTALTEVKIPTSITSISGDAFKRTKLKSIEIPNSVTYLGTWIFDDCKDLETVTIGTGLTQIRDYTFKGCKSLKSIILPPSIQSIGSYVFQDCTGLESIYMGPNVKQISDLAFTGATALKNVFITAQTPPVLSASSFPEAVYENATLYLQGDATESAYRQNDIWAKFTNPAVVVPLPVSMSTYNGDNLHSGNPLTIQFGKTATHSFLLKKGGSVTYTTALQGTQLDVNKIFWTSSASGDVYVDAKGCITNNVSLNKPVTITGRSIYANGPVLEITITGCSPSESTDLPLYFSITSEEDRTCAVAASDEGITEISIPETAVINGKEYTVTSIGDMAFYNRDILTTVNFPNTIESIGYRAFYKASLTELNLPSSLKTITGAAFEFNEMTKVVIPNSVTSLGSYAFTHCPNLKEITLSHHISAIGRYTFQGCTALESIVLPPAVKTIGENAFEGCSALTSIYMGPNVTSIGANTFLNATKLANIYITAQKAPAISENTFPATVYQSAILHLQGEGTASVYKGSNYWSKFTNEAVLMPLPSEMSTYNNDNLYSSSPLKVSFGTETTHDFLLRKGGSVRYITTLKFDADHPDNNTIFWTSEAPDKVYVDYDGKISNRAILEKPVVVTGSSLYANGPKLKITITGCYPYDYENTTLYYMITDEENKTCSVVSSDEGITYAPVPETAVINDKEYTVTSIGQLAFYQRGSLTSVSIPTTVETIGYRSFYKAGLTELEIPTSVTAIMGASFENNNFKEVVIPNSVTSIGGYAFNGCKQLQKVTLSHSITYISYYTFQNCTALKTIVIPPSVTRVDQYAFYGCSALESVYMGPNITNIGSYVFAGATALADIYITAQKAPAVISSTFPAYTATLHLQGKDTPEVYKVANYWQNFEKTDVVVEPTHMTLSIPGSSQSSMIKAGSTLTTEEHIYGNTGEVYPRTATLENENGGEVTIPHVFWSTSDPSKVYVDHNGTITLNEAPEAHKPVTVTAQSLYADAPTRTVTVDNEIMTGIDEILPDDMPDNGEQSEEGDGPTRIYTIGGVYVGSSLNKLSPGIYIVSQGRKTVKITVR